MTTETTRSNPFYELRQGDCVVSTQEFVFLFDPKEPFTKASKETQAADPEQNIAVIEVEGFVILTQTCDLIKSPEACPFVEVAALVRPLKEEHLPLIKQKKMPRYVEVPGVFDKGLVADLDQIVTVEKPALLKWHLVRGCSDDHQTKSFASAIARKRNRAALPDDFNLYIKEFQTRCKERHGKATDEGRVLTYINEIRVYPQGNWWTTEKTEVFLWFLIHPQHSDKKELIKTEIGKLLTLIKDNDKYSYDHKIIEYGEMSAKEYVASQLLDYDYLS